MNYIKATASIVFQKSSSGLAFAFTLILNSKALHSGVLTSRKLKFCTSFKCS